MPKATWFILGLVGALLIVYLLFFVFPLKNIGSMCVQVIVEAKNPITGEIREFPTPCDVPLGWQGIAK